MTLRKSIACGIVSIESQAPSFLSKVCVFLTQLVDFVFFYISTAIIVKIVHEGILVHLLPLAAGLSTVACIAIGAVPASTVLWLAVRIIERDHHARGETNFRAFNDAIDSGIYTFMGVFTAMTMIISLLVLESFEVAAMCLVAILSVLAGTWLHTWAHKTAPECTKP
jgi:hypothetical protein